MKLRIQILLFILFILLQPSFSQDIWDQPVPVDSSVRIGKLENGMTYFIRHNQEPKERVSFYIIQNVGALLEEDDQNGLAHFLEHMAFNGTKHFPGKGIINYLEKNGIAFGRNINAYTSFNETVYNLSEVPSTNPGLLDSCLLVLNDWSNYLLLSDEEIDAERGVIAEEWRTRRDANFRMRSIYFPVLLKDSKFAVRDVIGDLEVINNFDPESLRKFYHDWYRTDLQAIAIVGDIDVDEMEAKVIERFSKIPAVENPKPRPFFEIPEHEETRFVLATDKEATNSSIYIYMKRKGTQPSEKNLGYLRESYINSLFNRMMNDRISELLQKGEPPFINGGIALSGFLRGYESAYISINANPDEQDKGLRAILTETERMLRYGFAESELERAKTNLLMSMESAYKQRDKISNDRFVYKIQSHFLTGEPLTDPEFDWEFGQKVLQTISVEDVSKKGKEWFVPVNRVIVINGPEDGVEHLTKEEVFSILEEVKKSEIDPYEDAGEEASLIREELKGAKIVSTRKLEEFDAVEWKLSNNATVIFKHADFEKDNVSVRAFSPGGSSLFDTDELASAMLLSEFISSFGLGEFDAIALKKVLTGKNAGISTRVDLLSESITGSGTPKDFEIMMQLLYLQFSEPRFDEEAYNALKSRYIAYLANMANNPQKIMGDTLNLIANNYHERIKLLTADVFDEISFEKMKKLFNERFMDAGDFTFILVGNIEEELAREMVVKYIGSMEDDPRNENWVDNQIRGPKGKVEKQIEIPLETEKATVVVSFKKEMPYNPESNIKLSVLKEILQLRYTEEIREKEGGTYGVSVGASSRHFPYERKAIQMNFDADPEKADHLKSLIYTEIDKIVENGPTSEDLEKVVLNFKKEREESKAHNSYWSRTIYSYYFHGINFDAPENFDEVLDNLSAKDMHKFAKKFFKKADIIDVVFIPKK